MSNSVYKNDGSKFRFLIVDDSAFTRNMIKKIIADLDGEVVGEAENGIIGVEQFKELKPDIVTMDITMPEKNGLEAVSDIMNIDKNANIIMVSALNERSKIQEAIKLGAKYFFLKPFKHDQVVQIVSEILKKTGL